MDNQTWPSDDREAESRDAEEWYLRNLPLGHLVPNTLIRDIGIIIIPDNESK